MAKRRTRYEIYSDLLDIVARRGACRLTRASYGANLPVDRAKKSLAFLALRGFVKEDKLEDSRTYRITKRGLEYLETFKQMRKLYSSLVSDYGITIFISTHILNEVEQLAHRICIIDQGRIIEEVDTETIKRKNRKFLMLKVSDDRGASRIIETSLHINDFVVVEKGTIHVYDRIDDGARIVRALVNEGIDVLENTVMKDSLEDYFLSLTGTAYHE